MPGKGVLKAFFYRLSLENAWAKVVKSGEIHYQ
jgi:hypothetical protein